MDKYNKIIKLNSISNIEYKITEDTEIFLIGSNNSSTTIDIMIDRPGIKFKANGFFLCQRDKSININVNIFHMKKETVSEVIIKSYVADKAKFTFNGLINIAERSVDSNAYLNNRNLIASDASEVISSPMLEINTSESKAFHGVSTSGYDGNMIHYLSSRGISEIQAKKLIARGFIDDIIQFVENGSLRKDVKDSLKDIYGYL